MSAERKSSLPVRRQLERLQARARAAAASNARDLRDVGDEARQAAGDETGSGAGADAEVIAAQLTLSTRETDAIARALARLKSGRYGVCEGCQQGIEPKRLKALPYAARCVKCQTAWEAARRK